MVVMPPEAAACVEGIDENLLRVETRGFCSVRLVDGLKLITRPNVAALRRELHHTVERLHGRVRQIRRFIHRFDLFGSAGERTGCIAHAPRHRAWLIRQLHPILANAGAADVRMRAFVPLDRQCIARLDGVPSVVRNHRHAGWDLHHMFDSGHGLGLCGIEAANLAAENRAPRSRRVKHVG